MKARSQPAFSKLLLALVLCFGYLVHAQTTKPGPATNRVVDLNTPRTFPAISSAKQWEERAKEIRQQVLVSCGLWPMPEKKPIAPQIFGKIERDGYSIEKVYFETWPGLYLAGNLYRPLGRGHGPFPAILNPHGHWSNGRMADTKDGSIAGRCISFARQGMIAFSYDMIGYNDTHFADASPAQSFSDIHHQVATNKTDLLWNISLMGLQTWDSIRALDFLETLPDADPKRLAVTGESGGGTQTFMLGSIENRLAAQAPVVMVSHTMQGGCLCENAPGLRVEFSNMEIAAAAAPRPQLLVAATGDWTKDTPTVEGPSIAHIYQLLNHPERFSYVRFNFDHNYNQTSREAVYSWFGKWLLGAKDPAALKEKPFTKEPDDDLRVFVKNELPQGAMPMPQFLKSLREMHRRQWKSLLPQNGQELARYQSVMLPAWRHTLQVDWPNVGAQAHAEKPVTCGQYNATSINVVRIGHEPGVLCTHWIPSDIKNNPSKLVVVALANPTGRPENVTAPPLAALPFLQQGLAVVTVDAYSSGSTPDVFRDFYTTYNRTELQERVGDLMAVCAAARSIGTQKASPVPITLSGSGRAGLYALLAAPAADAVIADCDSLDLSDESTLLAPDLFCPGILAMGGFEAAAVLAAPHPLFLHNTGVNFPTDSLQTAYQAIGVQGKLRIELGHQTDSEIALNAAHF
ncbi:MAG TPA: acetylxylan esterase [Patescibacteria group bacterium]|nr:acetylxylan esterase [Patescibacteria group bacterium]